MHAFTERTRDCNNDGDRLNINRTGNPAMETGSTGDVLSGIAGAYVPKDSILLMQPQQVLSYMEKQAI